MPIGILECSEERFVELMVDCARALADTIARLMKMNGFIAVEF